MGFATGLYYCGTILLALAVIGLLVKLGARAKPNPNQAIWDEITRMGIEGEEDEDGSE